MPATPDDFRHLQRAIDLAEPWMGATRPNPAVGCVLVSPAGATIAEGWHERPGEAHAEAMALRAAGEAARGCTAVVTLEPCNHYGRTPPCAAALVTAGVARVVYGVSDPHPDARGGHVTLRAAGIEVVGPDELTRIADADGRAVLRRAAWLVAPFVSAATRGRPLVVAKWAMTLDGRIATRSGDSKWITGEAARAHGHGLRAALGAVAVGAGTLRTDDPLLTYRGDNPRARQPLRIVFGGADVNPADGRKLFRSASADQPVLQVVSETAAPLVPLPAGVTRVIAPDLPAALQMLTRDHGVQGLLLEGGSRLLGSAFDARIVDRVAVYLAPKLIGGSGAPGPVAGVGVAAIADALELQDVECVPLGADWLLQGELHLVRASRGSAPES